MANMFALILVHLNGGNVRQRRRRLPVTHWIKQH